ncbi:hypothetical protein EDC04DRAFT_2575262 [Pisolithus marmoratus]|nr:hypothetical protein EDC04DRAFT_2575262 [Pisolithus marmoratus]
MYLHKQPCSCSCYLQDALPKGATLLGVILSSDKTHITQVGNHQAHPLLISLANISADIHRKGIMKSYLLLALLPVPKFVHPNKHLHGVLADQLLHQVISIVIKPLKQAAESGHMMSNPLRNLKYCFTIHTIWRSRLLHSLYCIKNLSTTYYN